jgi:hypothetical protein
VQIAGPVVGVENGSQGIVRRRAESQQNSSVRAALGRAGVDRGSGGSRGRRERARIARDPELDD